MIILGIDPGYDRCGFAVLDATSRSKPWLKTFGIIKTDKKDDFQVRQAEVAHDFEALLAAHKPEIVSIEDLFFVQNVTTGMKVAQIRGIISYLAHKAGAKVVEPKPVEIKQSFCGDGKADKKQMQEMARILFDLKKGPTVDDSADAIGAAFWAIGMSVK